MRLQLALEVAGQRVAGQMQQQAGRRIATETMCATSSAAVPAPVTTISKPSARASSAAVARPTANSGSSRASASAADATSRRAAPLRLVAISACTPSRSIGSASSKETLSSGSTVASCPCSSSARSELERVGLGPGDEQAHQASAREEVGPGLGQQLGGGVLGQSQRLLGAALAARRVALAAVGREDHAAEDETAAGELGEAGDRRAAGAVEPGEEGALGRDGTARSARD